MKPKKSEKPQRRKLSPEAEIALKGLAQVELLYSLPPKELKQRLKRKPLVISTETH